MSTPMIICHGGAGHGAKDQPGVDEAADAGWRVLNSGGSALEAVMVAVELMENNPRLNAGTGGRHRSDGSATKVSRLQRHRAQHENGHAAGRQVLF